MVIKEYLSNLHTHTHFSDGNKTAERNIERALELGFLSLGISDHSPTPMWGSNFPTGNEKQYTADIRALADKYRGQIDIFAGIELDSFFDFHREYYDYVIASVHFIKIGDERYPVDWSPDSQREVIDKYFGGRNIDYVKTYYNDFVEHVHNSKPDIIGHLDLYTKYNVIDQHTEEYANVVSEAIAEMMKTCSRFEINTGAISKGYKSTFFPEYDTIKEIYRQGGSVILNSDCHNGVDLNSDFDSALKILKGIGFTHVDRLTPEGFVSDEISAEL